MSRFFFLANFLPPLKVGEAPQISFKDLMALYRENLSGSGWKKVQMLRFYIDIKNIERVLKSFPIDSRGVFNQKELEDALLYQRELPEFLLNFLRDFPSPSKQLDRFPKILVLYFQEIEKKCRGLVQDYFRFERKWRVVFAGYRAKNLGVDLLSQLQDEELSHPIVSEVLAQKDSPDFVFPIEFEDLDKRLTSIKDNPMEQYRLVAEYQFDFIEEKMEQAPFSLDYFLGYLLQLLLVEDVDFLDGKKANSYLNEMMKDVI